MNDDGKGKDGVSLYGIDKGKPGTCTLNEASIFAAPQEGTAFFSFGLSVLILGSESRELRRMSGGRTERCS
jgi:hypothetical protein